MPGFIYFLSLLFGHNLYLFLFVINPFHDWGLVLLMFFIPIIELKFKETYQRVQYYISAFFTFHTGSKSGCKQKLLKCE